SWTRTVPFSIRWPSTTGLPPASLNTARTRPSTGAVTRAARSATGMVVPNNSVHSSRAPCTGPCHLTVAGGAFSSVGTEVLPHPATHTIIAPMSRVILVEDEVKADSEQAGDFCGHMIGSRGLNTG